MQDNIVNKNRNAREQAGIRSYLWSSARRNFYYADDAAAAAAFCDRLIALFPLSEEADEARLLLHDIGTECRTAAKVGRTGSCLYCPQDVLAEMSRCAPCRAFLNSLPKKAKGAGAAFGPGSHQTTKISLAIAVVALPIIGIAKGGIIGIGLPEVIALVMMEGLFWSAAKMRNFRDRFLKSCSTQHGVAVYRSSSACN